MTTLIYCASGNPRFARIALDAGFKYGAQLPNTIYYPPYFVDQNWRKPDRARYMAALAEHRPALATVLDLERDEQLHDVLGWAEEAAQYVTEVVIVIPKAHGIIAQLPRQIGGRQVRLGYSVPTRYGGTEVWVGEFAGWPVHLLGGSPNRQLALRAYMDVRSADGNFLQLMATRYNTCWQNHKWVRLDALGQRIEHDAPYAAFALSCANLMKAWNRRGLDSCPTPAIE